MLTVFLVAGTEVGDLHAVAVFVEESRDENRRVMQILLLDPVAALELDDECPIRVVGMIAGEQ